jgi:hypothetical protein
MYNNKGLSSALFFLLKKTPTKIIKMCVSKNKIQMLGFKGCKERPDGGGYLAA